MVWFVHKAVCVHTLHVSAVKATSNITYLLAAGGRREGVSEDGFFRGLGRLKSEEAEGSEEEVEEVLSMGRIGFRGWV